VNAPAIIHPLRILLVENHTDTRRLLKMYLEQLGHTVRTATNKAEALREASTSACDVLLSDIGLSDGDAWDLPRQAQFPHPVFAIAMSGYGLRPDKEKSIGAGFRRHIRKPFDLDVLDRILDEAAREMQG
jgi:CheY-like chemotaxis protein